MADSMLPHNVADYFVKQYYMILDKYPEDVHKFYREQSVQGWPAPNGAVTPVTTISGINDKVMSSDCKNCSAEVKTVDSQEFPCGGIIVAVTGSLTGKDNSKRDFFQTFFLAKQGKEFFILNDILRFFDHAPSVESGRRTSPCSFSDSKAPQVVAGALVEQYYFLLNKQPKDVHKFYQKQSVLHWAAPNGVVTPVTTISGINDKIMSSDCTNCSAKVKTVDSQESVDGGIIVAVTGSLTGKDKSERDFSQTFFLAKQERGFFVFIDILRFFSH